MPIVIDVASRLHEQQLRAAAKTQGAFVAALKGARRVASRGPELPAPVASKIRSAVGPAARGLDRQMGFASRTQDTVVDALERRRDARRRELPRALGVLVAPASRLIGSRDQIADHVAGTARDWADARRNYEVAVRDALIEAPPRR